MREKVGGGRQRTEGSERERKGRKAEGSERESRRRKAEDRGK